MTRNVDSTGSFSHTETASTTLGVSNQTFVFAPSAQFQWLDQDVTLQVDVRCDSPTFTGISYTYAIPLKTPARNRLISSVLKEHRVLGKEARQLFAWKAFRFEDSKKEAPEFLIIGSLKGYGLDTGAAVFITNIPDQPDHRVPIMSGTGNVILTDVAPGEYRITIDKIEHVLTLSKEGVVTFNKAEPAK